MHQIGMQSKGMQSEASQQTAGSGQSSLDLGIEIVVLLGREVGHVRELECGNDHPMKRSHRLGQNLEK